MRKETKKIKEVVKGQIQGYHSTNTYSENYAFAGFEGNWYFTSDRCIALTDSYERSDGQSLKGYGLEIETECNGITTHRGLANVMKLIVFPNFKFGSKMFKMQSDGSLGGRTSVEVITQVMTKSRIRNDYSAYRAMFDDYFPDFGIKADSYSTACGMHVNVSNAIFGDTEPEQIENIRKLYYLVNRWYKFMTMLFYRDPRKTHWCGEMNEYNVGSEFDWHNARNIDVYDAPSSHGNCMNLSHFEDGRIEIRLVGGQNKYYTFRNTMECVFFLTENIRKLKWEDLEDLTKVFKGCNQYVMKRLVDCIGQNGFTSEMYSQIDANHKFEDLELRNA